MSTFVVSGPYEIDVTKGKAARIIDSSTAKVFWENCQGISSDVGCYIFAFRAGKGIKPVYIGKATKSFKQEVFTDHKKNKYNEALSNQAKGTPVLFFVSLERTTGPLNKKAIDEVETFLIQTAMVNNPYILNDRKTAIEQWGIKGVIRGGSGKTSGSAKSLCKCLGI